MRAFVGWLLGLVVRLWVATWRVRVHAPSGLWSKPEPLVFAFWHGRQMALLAATRRRPCWVLVSHSRDGALQVGVMRALGLRVVRGSSSRGGAGGLRAILRALASNGADAGFAVDGPRGPAFVAKPGAARAARLARGLVVPVGSSASRALRLGRAWDDFEIPLPFARVAVCLGEPLGAQALEVETHVLGDALRLVMSDARESLAVSVGRAPKGELLPG